jgi:hypothetical protein
MKEDLEAILVTILAWGIGVIGWAIAWFVIGFVARLTWIPLSIGWNAI